MADVAATKERVQRMLTQTLGTVQVDQDGDFTFRHGSARVFIRVMAAFGDHTVVRAFAYTNLEVPPSPELFHFVATNNAYVFGHLTAVERDEGVTVVFGQTILGDSLDPDELMTSVAAVASSADDVDDKIQQRFGGKRFHEDE